MKNQLSKREYKYRCKIIAENHLNKECQRYLDYDALIDGGTYYELYFNKVHLHVLLANYKIWSMGRTFYKLGISATQAANNFNNMACIVNAMSQSVKIDNTLTNIQNTTRNMNELYCGDTNNLLRLAENYASKHIVTCVDVLDEVERKIREDGYTLKRCIRWLKKGDAND